MKMKTWRTGKRIWKTVREKTPLSYLKCKATSRFTIVELLIVVAVIAILAGMLLPALNKAMQRAKTTNCIGNYKQIYSALIMYSNDWMDALPPICNKSNPNSFITYLLGPYMNLQDPPTKVPKILWCPSYPTTFPEQTSTTSFTGTYTGTAGWANTLSSSGGAYQGCGYYREKTSDGWWYGAFIPKLRGDLIIMTQMEPIWMSYNKRFGYNDPMTFSTIKSLDSRKKMFVHEGYMPTLLASGGTRSYRIDRNFSKDFSKEMYLGDSATIWVLK